MSQITQIKKFNLCHLCNLWLNIISRQKKQAPSRDNGLSKPQASLLHAFCARNYIRLPLTRQHKTSVFVSRFTS